jgi:hypothetical protein
MHKPPNCFHFLVDELVEVRADLSSSSDVLPILKRVCHSKHLARLISIGTSYFIILHSKFAEFRADFDVSSQLQFYVHAEIANVEAHVVTNTRVVQFPTILISATRAYIKNTTCKINHL